MSIVAVIMAGGSGKRFWPLSREDKAKQSLALFSDRTLLGETITRLLPLTDNILVVSSAKQRRHIEADIAAFPGVRAIFEPVGRNTAPCIALALRAIGEFWGGDDRVAVLPADHHIADPEEFRATMTRCLAVLEKHDGIGTIGMRPTYPETGYGYIHIGASLADGVFAVERFEEKPKRERAEEFVRSGRYLWNGGIFLFRASTMRRELKTQVPDIMTAVETLPDPIAVTKEQYGAIRSISIDYAVMEKTALPICCALGDFGWSDVGGWASYRDLLPKDEHGNAIRGPAHLIDCRDNLVVNLTARPIFLLKKQGQLVVATDDALLCADLADHQEVRRVTEYLEKHGLAALL
ncbi:MAG TPA: sugar phosphate nucleotidyltransferase [bacterium]|nr:sugar phosphate nucleotidyltransferase [bacterium]